MDGTRLLASKSRNECTNPHIAVTAGHYDASEVAVLEAVAAGAPGAILERVKLLWHSSRERRAVDELRHELTRCFCYILYPAASGIKDVAEIQFLAMHCFQNQIHFSHPIRKSQFKLLYAVYYHYAIWACLSTRRRKLELNDAAAAGAPPPSSAARLQHAQLALQLAKWTAAQARAYGCVVWLIVVHRHCSLWRGVAWSTVLGIFFVSFVPPALPVILSRFFAILPPAYVKV
jgi:hypothetical protein